MRAVALERTISVAIVPRRICAIVVDRIKWISSCSKMMNYYSSWIEVQLQDWRRTIFISIIPRDFDKLARTIRRSL